MSRVRVRVGELGSLALAALLMLRAENGKGDLFVAIQQDYLSKEYHFDEGEFLEQDGIDEYKERMEGALFSIYKVIAGKDGFWFERALIPFLRGR